MNPHRKIAVTALLPLLFAVTIFGLFLVSYRYTSHTQGEERFIVYWAGMRSWLMSGTSPYSDETASYIQALTVRSGDVNARVTYPLYGGFIFLPFAAISSYALARALWMTLLGVALLMTLLLCLRQTGWRSSVGLLSFFILSSLLGYPSIHLLINGNATILAGLFLVAALEAIRSERDAFAGILLALATIQPLLVAVVLPFIIFWLFSQKRWLVLSWLAGLLVFLSVIGIFFIPDWVFQWFRNLLNYSDYMPPASPSAAFHQWWPGVGRQLGWGFSLIFVVSLLGEWWAARRRDFRWFLWTVGLTLVLAQWIGLPSGVENYAAFVLPTAIFAYASEQRGGKKAHWIISLILVVLFLGTWGIYFRVSTGQLRSALLFLLPLIMLILLYWVRWWAIRPPRLFVEEIRE
ncbi:MAG: DUF2029 domain-containing protein [Candidatus Atribacteria bacterium]|nr:DUF2029 domain-containing protein [Candidatus Atribacteria bacterium]